MHVTYLHLQLIVQKIQNLFCQMQSLYSQNIADEVTQFIF